MVSNTSRAECSRVTSPSDLVYSQFCSPSTFEERFFSPESCESGKVKPQQIFENTIAALFAMGGYSVVRLNGDEQLHNSKTKTEIGSVDLPALKY
ncbi:MAG: hypothetical protein ABSB40_09095 [Nitrososphaeria archaeon]|jgi:hypothetical protein